MSRSAVLLSVAGLKENHARVNLLQRLQWSALQAEMQHKVATKQELPHVDPYFIRESCRDLRMRGRYPPARSIILYPRHEAVVIRLLSQPNHDVVQITTKISMSHCLQLYRWFLLLLCTSATLTSVSVAALPRSASFSFIHLYTCPVCEAQHDYDFTTAVQLALDNLEQSNDNTLLCVNGSSYTGTEGGRSHSNIKEPDTVLPTIQAIPLQVGLNTPGWARLFNWSGFKSSPLYYLWNNLWWFSTL